MRAPDRDIPCDPIVDPSGNARALLRAVVEEDGPALRRFLLLQLRDASEVDDVVQDLYLRLLQNSDAVAHSESRRAYLVGMARNLVRDRHRDAQVRSRALAEIGFQLGDQVEPAYQERVLQAREGGAAVQRAMQRLRPKHREIYLMSRMQGVRNCEIADRLGISLRSVERHVSEISSYMRETLATCL